ncbi:hypothetical protein AGMMS49525_08090 [Bacteroidia bacterium]|nr:hypothetical protein AGMMS49525_08090 [Bacteroidia bacterium]
MEDQIKIRKATLADIPFIVEAIVHAEKSGTDILSYTTIFGLSEEETRIKLAEMLEEEVDGCELSVSSYLLAETNNQVVAALGGWIEGLDGMSSNDLKANLIGYYFPKSSFEKAVVAAPVIQELAIARTSGTIQIEIGYVRSEFRQHNLFERLIEAQTKRLLEIKNDLKIIESQIFACSKAKFTFAKMGYGVAEGKTSENPQADFYFPSNTKLLVSKTIKGAQ